MNRRAILRAIAAAPIAGRAAAEQAKLSLAGIASTLGGNAPSTEPSAPGNVEKFTTFADWFCRYGEAQARKRAHHVDRLDPDLVEMRSLPLVTKVRLQRERNYQRQVEEDRDWFARKLGLEGFVRWYP